MFVNAMFCIHEYLIYFSMILDKGDSFPPSYYVLRLPKKVLICITSNYTSFFFKPDSEKRPGFLGSDYYQTNETVLSCLPRKLSLITDIQQSHIKVT